MYSRFKGYFIAHRINATDNVFEKAKINVAFAFIVFMSILAIPFITQLVINGYWYHFGINIFEVASLTLMYILFRSNVPLHYISIAFVIMDSIMSAGSVIIQNGTFDVQAGFWCVLLILYAFFLLGKKWGLPVSVFIVLLFIGCLPMGEQGIALLNFGIHESQVIPSEPAFVVFPFLLNIYIVTVFTNSRRTAERLINDQNKKLEVQREEILSSITYAKRIQQAILPSDSKMKHHLPDSFVLYKPKDIVAGDFYWLEKVDDWVLVAVADCTGHGVPGAMLSVICNNAMNRAVREFRITNPAEILDKTQQLVLEAFEQDTEMKDGMDIALLAINTTTRQVGYAGAHNPCYYITGNGLDELAPNKQPIGQFANRKPYTCHTRNAEVGECFYLFSDGYADQFGGAKGKKFKYKPFRQLLQDNYQRPMAEQKQHLEQTFAQWKGNQDQVDDICIIGLRIL